MNLRRSLARVSPAVLLALLMAQLTTTGWPPWPWQPRLMDLSVYQHGGRLVLAGGDLLSVPDPVSAGLVFTYPPFAGLLAVPLTVLPLHALGVIWLAATAICLYAVLWRVGTRGWWTPALTAIAIVLVEPVRSTVHFGQVNILLLALVVLDLAPGRRVLPRRVLPEGLLTGLAAAIKLTPALFVVYLLFARRWRAAGVAGVTAVSATGLGWLLLPDASYAYWQGLLGGDNRTGYLLNLVNQSVTGALSRVVGADSPQVLLAMFVAALVGLAGAWAAGRVDRLGSPALGVLVCGVATLLASPVSWDHHFVWVLPLAVVLWPIANSPRGRRDFGTGRTITAISATTRGVRLLGLAFCGWVMVGAYTWAIGPWGHGEEAGFAPWQQLVAGLSALLGVAFVCGVCVAVAARRPAFLGECVPESALR